MFVSKSSWLKRLLVDSAASRARWHRYRWQSAPVGVTIVFEVSTIFFCHSCRRLCGVAALSGDVTQITVAC